MEKRSIGALSKSKVHTLLTPEISRRRRNSTQLLHPDIDTSQQQLNLWRHVPTLQGDLVNSRLANSTSMTLLPKMGDDTYLLDSNYDEITPLKCPSASNIPALTGYGATPAIMVTEERKSRSPVPPPPVSDATCSMANIDQRTIHDVFTLQIPNMGARRRTVPSLFTEDDNISDTVSICSMHSNRSTSSRRQSHSRQADDRRRSSIIENIKLANLETSKLFTEEKEFEGLPVHTILVVGKSGAGKTSLVKAMMNNSTANEKITHLSERKMKRKRNGVTIFEQIIRRTIQRRILQFVLLEEVGDGQLDDDDDDAFCREVDVVIYVYSITRRDCFEFVCECFERDCEETLNAQSILLGSTWVVGAKCDLAKQKMVNEEDVTKQRKRFLKKYPDLPIPPEHYPFNRHILTSITYNQRVSDLFIQIVNTAIDNHRAANVARMQRATTQLAKRSMRYLSKMALKVRGLRRKESKSSARHTKSVEK